MYVQYLKLMRMVILEIYVVKREEGLLKYDTKLKIKNGLEITPEKSNTEGNTLCKCKN